MERLGAIKGSLDFLLGFTFSVDEMDSMDFRGEGALLHVF